MKYRALLCLLLVFLLAGQAHAQSRETTVTVNGQALAGRPFAEDGVTYVHLVPLMKALGGWETTWDGARRTARTETDLFTLSAPIGQRHILVDGYAYELNAPILLRSGRTYVPLRAVAELLGAEVTFTGWNAPVTVTGKSRRSYTDEDFHWLSRVIYAESGNEGLKGQIAVGNVVLNRVASRQFPNTIRDVVFDTKDAVQFTPTENGTIYNTPSAKSALAARLTLAGADAVKDCMYFFCPALSQGTWIRQNCRYYTTIGCHRFYR